MAKAKKLPSGQWRTLVYDYTDDNKKRHYQSFTADTKKESEYLAAEFAVNKKQRSRPLNLTLGQAIDQYIEGLVPPICSVTTIAGYKKIRKYAFQSIMDVPLKKLTAQMINQAIVLESSRKVQRHCNGVKAKSEGKTLSPKTVRNEYGLISAVLNIYKKDIDLSEIKLPKVAPKIKEPLTPDIIYSVVKGTDMELPVLLAMWLSFTESEICGLTKSKSLLDNGKYICIDEVVVYADGKQVRKDTAKTVTRKRVLRLPEHIKQLIDQLPEDQDQIVVLSNHALYDRFRRILQKNNLPHMTFHDLRHVNASIMSQLQIPDKYAQERGGWKTDHVMKRVYTHTFSAERQRVDDTIDTYFEDIMQHEMQHESSQSS